MPPEGFSQVWGSIEGMIRDIGKKFGISNFQDKELKELIRTLKEKQLISDRVYSELLTGLGLKEAVKISGWPYNDGSGNRHEMERHFFIAGEFHKILNAKT